jgi:peptidoglycan/xylan/chitin deacetylase (PgdA/CDA1 family)
MLREELRAIVRSLARMRRRPVVFVFHDLPDRHLFERCISEIAASRRILPLDVVARRRQNDTCAITFDDGLRSVVDVARPVFAVAELPYTVFVCTDVVMGGRLPWFVRIDHLASRVGLEPLRAQWRLGRDQARTTYELTVALKEIPLDRILAGLTQLEHAHQLTARAPERLFLSPAEVGLLAAEGVTIGGHTCRHPILSKLSIGDQRHEIETSCDEIERLVGRRPSHFAYPNGSPLDFDATTRSLLRAAGVTFAYTTVPGYLSRCDDPLALPRIGIGTESPLLRAIKQLAPRVARNHAKERVIRSRVTFDEPSHNG